MAYRSRRQQNEVKPAEAGLVVDMVRQFADRYAFVRELVQNAVDAGGTRIDVRAELGPGGKGTFSVRDDGMGMARETIEGPLLTLFNSSKDTDRTKIGKYGVGFVSVFAIEPEVVVVESWRDGESWEVRLKPDHSYELAHGADRAGSGTSVTLIKPLADGEFPEHVAQIGAALRRWCRHAGLPIRYIVPAPGGGGTGELLVDERIDCPLSLTTALSVTQEVDGELIVVGPSAGALEAESPTFAGFYNRGLTLFETTQPPAPALAGIHLKIQSPHLQHTLSRDNLRHDEAYERVIREAEDIVAGPLRRKLRIELATAAQAVADGTDEGYFARLLTAACQPPVRLDLDEITVPLIAPLGKRHVLGLDEALSLGDGTLYVSSLADDLTVALARTHTPVVHVVHDWEISSLIARLESSRVQQIRQAFVLVEEEAADTLSPSDRALCRATLEALVSAGTRVERVGMADTTGLVPPRGILAVPNDAESRALLFSRHEAATWWSHWGAPKVLLLAKAHEAVKRARTRAEYSPAVAANLLARALLVEERGPLGKRSSDKLLAAGGEALARSRRRARK